MRKLVLAVAAMAVLLAAGVAYAANTYNLDSAKATPKGVGTMAKPVPKAVEFDYSTGTTDGTRPSPVTGYSIRFQGLLSFAKYFPSCSVADVQQKSVADVKSDCKKAIVGGGVVENQFGATSDTSQKTPCNLALTLINLGKTGLAIRLDRANPADCAVDPATSIIAKYKRMKVGGVATDALNFTVPANLTHPLPGVDNSVVRAQSNVKMMKKKITWKGKKRTVGYYSSVACGKRKKRTIQVEFTAESGQKAQANRTVAC
jgi:hypothetical protein